MKFLLFINKLRDYIVIKFQDNPNKKGHNMHPFLFGLLR